MTEKIHPVEIDELSAYLDGELDVGGCERVEAYISAHPEAAARLSEYRRRDEAIRRGFAAIDSQEQTRLLGGARGVRMRIPRTILLAAAGAFAGVVLVAAGWRYANTIAQDRMLETLAREAAAAHVRYTGPTEGRQLPMLNAEDVSKRLSGLLGMKISAPDLSRFAFRLVGFNELPADHGPAALLIYESANGDEVSCYFARLAGADESEFRGRTTLGTNVVDRLEPQLGYAVAGELSLARLQEVAGAGYKASLDRQEE